VLVARLTPRLDGELHPRKERGSVPTLENTFGRKKEGEIEKNPEPREAGTNGPSKKEGGTSLSR